LSMKTESKPNKIRKDRKLLKTRTRSVRTQVKFGKVEHYGLTPEIVNYSRNPLTPDIISKAEVKEISDHAITFVNPQPGDIFYIQSTPETFILTQRTVITLAEKGYMVRHY